MKSDIPNYIEVRRLVALVGGQFMVNDVMLFSGPDTAAKIIAIYCVQKRFKLSDRVLSQLFSINESFMRDKLRELVIDMALCKKSEEMIEQPIQTLDRLEAIEVLWK